jgi:hypothetical protein
MSTNEARKAKICCIKNKKWCLKAVGKRPKTERLTTDKHGLTQISPIHTNFPSPPWTKQQSWSGGFKLLSSDWNFERL